MLSILWLHIIKAYLRLGFFFYFRRVHVINSSNIPSEGPVLILGNHQNALLDALIIAVRNKRFSYFLTRASVFKSPFIAPVLKSLRMLPVYRIRDGIQTITKNNAIFGTCSQLLENNECIVVFPEGNHNLKRRVRPLSKGFTRIVFDVLSAHPEMDLQLIPVGFNYRNAEKFVDEVSLYVGNPIKAQDFVSDNRHESVLKLKGAVHGSLTKLTSHIPSDHYREILTKLEARHVDFLKPEQINTCISNNFKDCKFSQKHETTHLKTFLKGLLILNLWLPYLIWKWAIYPRIKEIEFVSTFRFVVAITLVPIYLVLVTVFLAGFIGWPFALIYLFIVLLLALLAVKI